MAYHAPLRRLRVLVPIALLIMVLMRLVWMQLRQYSVAFDHRYLISLQFIANSSDFVCDFAEGGRLSHAQTFGQQRPSGESDEPVWQPEIKATRPMPKELGRWLGSSGVVFGAWALCQNDDLNIGDLVRVNQALFGLTVLLATLMARFMSSSWTVSLIVATMLLSRGRLLGDLGHLGINSLAACAVTAWLTACAHFLRTGAKLSVAAAAISIVIASLVDLSLAALALAMPCLLLLGYAVRQRWLGPLLRKLRGTQHHLTRLARAHGAAGGTLVGSEEAEGALGRFAASLRWMLGMEFPPAPKSTARSGGSGRYERGGLFRTLDVPFLLWVYAKRRWLRFCATWLAVLGICLVLNGVISDLATRFSHFLWVEEAPYGAAWVKQLMAISERLDLHFFLSLLIVFACILPSPAAGLAGFLELCLLAVAGGWGVWLAAATLDAFDLALLSNLTSLTNHAGLSIALLNLWSPRAVLAWLEPAFLSLGVVGLYNLMKVLDSRFGDRA